MRVNLQFKNNTEIIQNLASFNELFMSLSYIFTIKVDLRDLPLTSTIS